MKAQSPEMIACYQTLLQSYPDVQGLMKVSFQIDADGQVTSAEVRDDETDSVYMRGCLSSVMQDLRFEPGTATTVTYPFQFKPE